MPDRELRALIDTLLAQEHLPETYRDTAMAIILPLAIRLQEMQCQAGRTLVVGINGAQGTGKSTLTLFLQTLLNDHLNCPCARFSLDDIYLTRAQRQQLADEVHPLLLTRGVPGTHDLRLGQQVIDQLSHAEGGAQVAIPAFDKARDDRAPEEQWPRFTGRAAIILVEGWCLGARPERNDHHLSSALNELERAEDRDGVWRRYVNHRLETDYAKFFNQLDQLIMLRAPSMECVLRWRTLQEHKLARRSAGAPEAGGALAEASPPLRIMSDEEVARFIMHYERITRSTLAEMPHRADLVIAVTENHELKLPEQESLL